MSNDDYITASEFAEYIYCNRAWWLRLTDYKSENQAALNQGAESHSQFAKQVNTVTRLEKVGRLILVLGVALLIIFILARLFLR